MTTHSRPPQSSQNERLDIAIREGDGSNPPKLLMELVDAINALIPDAGQAAGTWFRGKAEAEVAKAAEIKATVLQKVAEIEHDRHRLIHEREQSNREAENTGKAALFAHEQKMHELRTRRLVEAAQCITRLRELGAEIDIRVINSFSKELLNAVKDDRVS